MTALAIRAALSQRLPQYMIPTNVNIVERFPLTDTGKIDTKQLRVKPNQPLVFSFNFTKNPGPIDIVSEIWRDVLGVADISFDDNFFDLGGSSLLMARVHTLLLERLSTTIPLYRLYEYPTLDKLAQFFKTQSEASYFNEIDSRVKNRQKKTRENTYE
ncbi:MAG TPA: hypothetical protein DDY37_02255 [Legionella sp.]|nr:hypothetical protein [Legionella sp.]